jgi:hypothetical protein
MARAMPLFRTSVTRWEVVTCIKARSDGLFEFRLFLFALFKFSQTFAVSIFAIPNKFPLFPFVYSL